MTGSFVVSVRLQGLKELLLLESDQTGSKAIDICRTAKTSREQIKSISEDKATIVDALRRRKIFKDSPQRQSSKKRPPTSAQRNQWRPQQQQWDAKSWRLRTVGTVAEIFYLRSAQRTEKSADIVINWGILWQSAVLKPVQELAYSNTERQRPLRSWNWPAR